jgi:hypothetical protein
MGLFRMQTSTTVLILLLACIAPGAAVIVVFCRLRFGVATLPPTTAWIDEFSVERYRPVLRLLNDADVRFLGSHASVTRKLVAHFRRERCRILRGYLRSLATDFARVVAALKLVMTQASSDRPDLAALLIRSQATFAACMVLAHVQLLLYAFGIGTINVDGLLRVFEGMRLELRTLIPCDHEPATTLARSRGASVM